MSASVELQVAVLGLLLADATVRGLVGDRISDNGDGLAYPQITLGPSDASPDDADCIIGRTETLQVDVWTEGDRRKWPCREIVDAVKAALHLPEAEIDLPTCALVQLRVISTRVMEDQRPNTIHGVVTVEAIIEEA